MNLVFDVSHDGLVAGFAGQDSPSTILPSVVGVSSASSTKTYFIGTERINDAHHEMEISNYLSDGMIADWEAFEKVLDHVYVTCNQSDPKSHPLLMSEAPWNTKANREKTTEIMFEKYNVPAFYLAKYPVLSVFGHGRQTGLIVDNDSTYTSIIPVLDSRVFTQGVVRIPLGDDFLIKQCRQLLEKLSIPLIPPYMIGSKEVVKPHEQPKWIRKDNLPSITSSWHDYQLQEMIKEFQLKVIQVADSPLSDHATASKMATDTVHYEFSTGYRQDFGKERFEIAEGLFNHKTTLDGGICEAVMKSIAMCDAKYQPSLYASIIVTGNHSRLQGFPDRLKNDLTDKLPKGTKLKVISATSSGERQYVSWAGGSVLASMDLFQHMWISRQEYDEAGKAVVLEKKCP